MTGESTRGWAFLVARGHQAGYHLLLAPDFITANREYGLLLDEIQGEIPAQAPARVTDIVGPASGPLCLVHRTIRATQADVGATGNPAAPLLDRAGRPLVLAYGFVCRGAHVIVPDDQDLRIAREAAVATYRRFHAAEEEFAPETSTPYAVRSAVARAAAPAPRPTQARPTAPRSTAPWTSQILPDRKPAQARRRLSAVVLALIGVLALAGLAAGMSVFTSARQVEVPDVRGKASVEAAQLIKGAGLAPEEIYAVSSKPCGRVVDTRPTPHARVDRNSSVVMTISAGAGPAGPGDIPRAPACTAGQGSG